MMLQVNVQLQDNSKLGLSYNFSLFTFPLSLPPPLSTVLSA